MKRTVTAAALLLAAATAAQATSLDTYRDLVRPHGHPRSEAIFQAALDACYAATGASRFRPDTPAFRQCMLGRSYRWKSVQRVSEPRSRVSAPPYEPPPVEPSPPVVVEPPPTLVVDPMTGEVHPGP